MPKIKIVDVKKLELDPSKTYIFFCDPRELSTADVSAMNEVLKDFGMKNVLCVMTKEPVKIVEQKNNKQSIVDHRKIELNSIMWFPETEALTLSSLASCVDTFFQGLNRHPSIIVVSDAHYNDYRNFHNSPIERIYYHKDKEIPCDLFRGIPLIAKSKWESVNA